MMKMSELARSVDGKLAGNDALFRSVSTDTRTLEPGALFVALGGPNFDGNLFVDQAADRGAVGALVTRGMEPTSLPAVMVEDTRFALGSLAAYWRSKQTAKIFAVTGSNGKTTVKEILNSILSIYASGIATKGNLNNDIGMPLTLLRVRKDDRYAVLEMGMNHPGEIAYLTTIARPDVAIINNAAGAHLEGLGSIENVAKAKGEILQGLSSKGIAVLNADDKFFPLWKALAGDHKVLSFGIEQSADVSATAGLNLPGSTIHMKTPHGRIDVAFPLPGRHNVMNALAAAAAALAGGGGLEQIRQGLESVRPVSGRLVVRPGLHGATLLDDTYNANPASLEAAMDVLAEFDGVTILVLGDMGELGADARQQHARAGKRAAEKGIDYLLATGDLSAEAVKTFGSDAEWFSNKDELVAALKKRLDAGVAVLVKGSRASHMEQVSQELIAD